MVVGVCVWMSRVRVRCVEWWWWWCVCVCVCKCVQAGRDLGKLKFEICLFDREGESSRKKKKKKPGPNEGDQTREGKENKRTDLSA